MQSNKDTKKRCCQLKKKKKNVEISIDLHYFGVAETENLHAVGEPRLELNALTQDR